MGIWDNFKSALGFEDKIEVVASQPEQPMVTEAHAQALPQNHHVISLSSHHLA